MTRGVITIRFQQALGLREAIRPLANPSSSPIDVGVLIALHEKIMSVLVEFDTEAPSTVDLVLTRDDCLFISQFVSAQDGDWAADVLKQTRRAWYELKTGVLPAWAEDNEKIRKMMVESEDASARDAESERHSDKEMP